MSNSNSNKEYYTINQIADLCSVSRATLIRMEEDGILEPAYKNPKTGYRYYDSANAVTIIHNLSMQQLGLTHKEMKCYSPIGDTDVFLKILEHKKRHLEDLISEIQARLNDFGELSVEEIHLDESYYYTKTLKDIRYVSVIPSFIKETFSETLSHRHRINWRLPNCVIFEPEDFLAGHFSERPHDFTACIPIETPNAAHDENVMFLPATRAVCALVSGGYVNICTAALRLGEYIQEKNYKPSGKARFMGIINEFPNYMDPKNNHAARFVVPIEGDE